MATIRAAITAAIKDVASLHIPKDRRDHAAPAETLRPMTPIKIHAELIEKAESCCGNVLVTG